MKSLPLILFLWLAWTALSLSAESPLAADLHVRDTSLYVGSTFHFYIRVSGVDQAPAPRLAPAEPFLQIRPVGAAASNSRGELAYTFTYEAIPLRTGRITLPASELTVNGVTLTTPSRAIDVSSPASPTSMDLRLSLSQQECFVGEPVTLTVSWTSALSLNGIRAVDLRLPILGDPHFQVRPPAHPVDPGDPHAIGLPVASQRIIARYRETTLRGEPAMELNFEQVLIPVQPSSINLLLAPATLLCSFVAPGKAGFQGTRYPSHFNNDFFDEDVTGTFQRLFVQAPPLTIRIKPLPTLQRPDCFSGIVGAFALAATADPLTTPALSPVTFTLKASGYPFPHLLQIPPWKQHPALDHAFLVPQNQEQERGRVQPDGSVEFSVPLRPRSESTSAIPCLELAYFDPKKEAYEVVRTREIPLTVSPATPATVYDLEFSDGSKLRNDVEPVPGGITHNLLGASLLASQQPVTWTLQEWAWLLVLGLPPFLYALLLRISRTYRNARANPELARRDFAFHRLRKALHRLPHQAPPFAVSQLLRTYFADRFGLETLAGESPDLVSVARREGVAPTTAETLSGLIAHTDLHTFARQGAQPHTLGRRELLNLVRQFERNVPKWTTWFAMLALTLTSWGASPEESLQEACAFFDRANETAPVNPAQARDLYRLATQRFETLVTKHGIRNGPLYYNLGNTHFLSGDLGRAIVNYLRAQQYIPTDLQLADALREARLRQVDNFPQAMPTRLWQTLFFWHYHLGPRSRFWMIAGASASIWGLLGLHLFLPLGWRWKAVLSLSVIILLAGGSSLIHAKADPRRAAVIVQPEILPRKGDAQIYDPAFTNPLHSGAEIIILEQRRDWLRIQVQDGSQGWIPAAAAERVIP